MRKFYTFVILLTAMLCGFSTRAWAEETALSENFDSGSLDTNGWTKSNCANSTNIYQHGTSGTHSGNWDFRFYYNTNPPQYLISKLISIPGDATDVTVSFYYKAASVYQEETFQVGYSTSTNDVSAFTWYSQIATKITTWTLYSNNTLPAGTKYIAIKYNSYDKYYLYIDDILVTYDSPTSCPKPGNFAASVASSTSASITWKKNGEETAWDLQYSDDNFTTYTELNLTNSNVSVDGSGNCSYTLSGLSAQTTYKVQVRANCGGGDESTYTNAISFTTPCTEITSFPWIVNFNGETVGTIMNCWDNSSSTTSTLSSNPAYVWGVYEYNSNKMLRMYNWYVNSGTALINTPGISLPASPSYKLTFKYAHNATCGAFNVKVSTNNGASFTNIGTYTKGSGSDKANPGTFTDATISLASYAGQTIILQFFANANYDDGAIFIDDVEVRVAQDCSKPTTSGATNITSSGARISWTAKEGVTSYKYICKTSSTAPTSSEWESAATESNTYKDLTGLSAETTYYYWVMCACGTVASDARSFTTDAACPSVSTVTLSNKYYDRVTVSWTTSSPTNCDVRYKAGSGEWTTKETNTSATTTTITGLTSGTTYTIQVKPNCSADGWVAAEAYTPICPTPGAITKSLEKYNSVHITWAQGSTEDSWRVRYRKGSDSWTTSDVLTSRAYDVTGLISGNTYTIEVYSACCEGGAASIAYYTPICSQPGTITFSNETHNSVVVGWGASGTIDHWNLQYKETAAEDVPANWTDVAMNTTSRSGHTISGLTTGTTYTIRVTAACCTADARETTYTPAYTAPNQPSAGSLTETSARITWGAVADASGYQYVLMPGGSASADWTSPTTATSPLNLEGLTPGTSYDIYVRSVYPTGYSTASTKRNFSTTTVAPTITSASPTELTSSSATFAWTKSGYTTGVKYQWKIGSGSWSEPISGTSVNVTGLSANTSYTFYVRTYYSASVQSTAASKAFKTDCGAITVDEEHPWTYNFNSDASLPECWSSTRSDYSSSPVGFPKIETYSGVSSSKCLSVSGGETYGYMYIILPQFNVALNNLVFSFYYKNYASYWLGDSDPQFSAGYFTTPGDASTFVSLGALERKSTYTKAEYDLIDVPEEIDKIVIRYGGGSGGNIQAYIDDVEVKISTGCAKPVNPTCSSTTSSSATLSWTTRPADSWQIQYSVNSDFSSSTTVDAATNPFTITGLSSNTQYYARVRGYCDEEYTDWSITSVAFHTDCGEIASDDLPWSYGFETNTLTGSGNIPQCWKSISVDLDDYWGEPYTYPYVYDISAHTGSNLLYFYGGVTGTSDEYAILPEMEDDLKDLTIEFYHKELFSASDYAQFTVGYLTDVTDASTFVPVQAITRNSEYTQAKVAMSSSVPTTVHNFVILFSGGSSDTYGYIDDIKVYPTAAVFTNADGDNLWSNDDNWLMGAAPTISDDAIIRKPVTIDAGTKAVAKSVVVDQISTRTGEIAIEATGELVIADTLRRVTGSVRTKTFSPTTENDLYIGSTTSGNGGLVIGTHNGTNKATIDFYTKSYGKKEQNTSVAQYVGTPYNDETNILYNWYNSWVYGIEYTDGNIGWKRIEEGEGMTPFEGYCVFSADAWDEGSQKDGGHTYWMQGTLVSSDNHTCSGLNWKSGAGTEDGNNENLLANSWAAPIKIRAFEASDFVNADATIYIFNSTSNSAYMSIDGNYTAYPINTAATTATIPSMQSFSVFTNASGGSSVTLNYKRLVYDPAVAGLAIEANRAPRRESHEADDQDETDRMYLYVTSDSEFSDVVYLIENDECTSGFDNGWDGRKLFGESYAPQLYVQTSDGKMSVNCSPAIEGTVVGLTKGDEDDAYTFTFDYEGNGIWYLNDIREKQSTRISQDYSYRFFATADDAARFIISRTPIDRVEVATDLDNGTGTEGASNARKLMINDILYIIRDGRMFDATGVMVR